MVSEQRGALGIIYQSAGSQCYLEWQCCKLLNSWHLHMGTASTGRASARHSTLSPAQCSCNFSDNFTKVGASQGFALQLQFRYPLAAPCSCSLQPRWCPVNLSESHLVLLSPLWDTGGQTVIFKAWTNHEFILFRNVFCLVISSQLSKSYHAVSLQDQSIGGLPSASMLWEVFKK